MSRWYQLSKTLGAFEYLLEDSSSKTQRLGNPFLNIFVIYDLRHALYNCIIFYKLSSLKKIPIDFINLHNIHLLWHECVPFPLVYYQLLHFTTSLESNSSLGNLITLIDSCNCLEML